MILSTEDFIINLFCLVDDKMKTENLNIKKHPQSKLYPSELVTIGILFALKGVHFRAFYRWLYRDYLALFPKLPERSRLQRLLKTHKERSNLCLAEPSLLTVMDSYGIELIHPWREGRSQAQLGKKGKSNHRWIVGIKLCWLINKYGQVVGWDINTANVHDHDFNHLAERFIGQTIVLADTGFQDRRKGIPQNLKLCPRGTWNNRMLVETALSMLTIVCHIKHWFHRKWEYLRAHAAYLAALFNVVLALNRQLYPQAREEDLLHIAQYSL
jgi:hypothetical protein